MHNKTIITAACALIALMPVQARAQRVLTLEDCKQMAIDNNNDLKLAQKEVEMAGYDRKIAASYFYPKVQAAATYQWTDHSLQLLSDEQQAKIAGMGTEVQQSLTTQMTQILSDPTIYTKMMSDPALQKFVGYMQQTDLATPINAIGSEINDAFNVDTQNIIAGIVSVEQPVFVGGKIIASTKMAKYAQELAETKYSQQEQQIAVDIEQAYWQIVAIASKKKLAEGYSELLDQMMQDTDALVEEGLATNSDALSVKVKANEAKMLLTKATNGLSLSKMLLCQKVGLPLDTEIRLADEGLDAIPVPQIAAASSDDEVYANRPEIKSLTLANDIYHQKYVIARADMMPTIGITANYVISNPNLNNGFQNEFGGIFAAGVVMKVPIFHGTEALQKTRKAKAEATYNQIRLDDAKGKVSLQVAQCRKQQAEALEKLDMCKDVMDDAEENLRIAHAGYVEGAVSSNTVLQAQTAWLQAHSEYIEAGVDLQVSAASLAKAEGRL